MEDLSNILLKVDRFFEEGATMVDGLAVPCRPIYLEYVYLYPEIFRGVTNLVGQKIVALQPDIIVSPEAAILPLAASICMEHKIPLCVARKPNHEPHEPNEPTVFMDLKLKEKNIILFDDAIWSGTTINFALKNLELAGVRPSKLVFIFDFLMLPRGGMFIDERYKPLIETRISLIKYTDFLKVAFDNNRISNSSYKESLKLIKSKEGRKHIN